MNLSLGEKKSHDEYGEYLNRPGAISDGRPYRNILITGGSEGIGRGLAERFLKIGGTVLVTSRDQD